MSFCITTGGACDASERSDDWGLRAFAWGLTAQLTGVATVAGTVQLVLPDPPQLLTGTLKDTGGNPIPSNGNGFNLMLTASNSSGRSLSNVDTSGNFSFYVPPGSVDVLLGSNSTGFFSRNDAPNAHVPGYIWNISPTVPWSASDGPLDLTLPPVVPIAVHVTSGGGPVQGASVSSSTTLTSAPFTLRAATGGAPAITTTVDFYAGAATTDVHGDATLMVYPTVGQTFTVDASAVFQGVTLGASSSGVPTNGNPQSVGIVLGQ